VKLKTKVILFTTIFLVSVSTVVLASYANTIGWNRKSRGAEYAKVTSKFLNMPDKAGTTIMTRIRGSYSYNRRRPSIEDTYWKQFYTGIYNYVYPQIGNESIPYDNITTTLVTPDSKLGVTEWYDSPYGVFLDYHTRHIKDPADSVIDYASEDDFEVANKLVKPTQPVKDSIDYAKLQFGKSDSVYIASTQQSSQLADAKIGAVLGRNPNKLFPILLNSPNTTLDTAVLDAIKDLEVKNIYILGGTQRFDVLAGLTGKYNMIRCGGKDRTHTQVLMRDIPKRMEKENPFNYDKDNEGIVFYDYGKILSSTEVAKYKSVLKKELEVKNGSKIVEVVDLLINYINEVRGVPIGSQPSSESDPSFVIGVNTEGYQAFWICYWSEKDKGYVYQYILDDYFDDISSVSIEYRDIDTNNIMIRLPIQIIHL